jgi:RNA polymerase sigma-70 factor (sigma-E family)
VVVDAADPVVLHRTYYVSLVRLAVVLVGDRETAEDVVQDVFARMQGRWFRLRDPEKAIRYLRISVVNEARSVLRHRRVVTAVPPDPLDSEPAAEEHALRRMVWRDVRAAISALPRRQREVIVLRYVEGLSIVETARVLRISHGAVKSSAGRAMASLAKALGASNE